MTLRNFSLREGPLSSGDTGSPHVQWETFYSSCPQYFTRFVLFSLSKSIKAWNGLVWLGSETLRTSSGETRNDRTKTSETFCPLKLVLRNFKVHHIWGGLEKIVQQSDFWNEELSMKHWHRKSKKHQFLQVFKNNILIIHSVSVFCHFILQLHRFSFVLHPHRVRPIRARSSSGRQNLDMSHRLHL